MVFGYTWYMYCDGVLRVKDFESCKDAIQKIQGGFIPDQQKIINFLKVFDEVSIRGYRDYRFRDGADLNKTFVKDDEENAKNISAALYQELSV